ncbi:acylphosphatase [Candidatus Woesearchaeota archaeon]|nr:acylphosphatase [Candidatus Woesearchaeota archaeon]
MEKVRLLVKGKVQGVSFRAFTKQSASILGLAGFVKNLSSGDVEIIVHGNQNKISQFILKLKMGSLMAKVDSVEKFEDLSNQEFNFFDIRF